MKYSPRHCVLTVLIIFSTFGSIVHAAAPVIPAGQDFVCNPTHVWDGDGPIWCREGPRIRLAGIAARELDGTCKKGHPCPRANAIVARDGLAGLVGTPTGVGRHGHILIVGPAMRCHSDTAKSAQMFLSIHASIYNIFNVKRHLISRKTLRQFRDEAMSIWQLVTVSA